MRVRKIAAMRTNETRQGHGCGETYMRRVDPEVLRAERTARAREGTRSKVRCRRPRRLCPEIDEMGLIVKHSASGRPPVPRRRGSARTDLRGDG